MTKEIETSQNNLGMFLIKLMPVEWEKIWLYAECEDNCCSFYLCFKETQTSLITTTDFFWERYNVYPFTERETFRMLSNFICEIYKTYKKTYGQEKIWTTMTYIIESSGEFNIDFTYETIQENMVVQRRKWEIKYFGREIPYTTEKYPY